MRILSLLFTVVVSVAAFAQVPTITSFSPVGGASVGSSITITGTNFVAGAANNKVYFGKMLGTVTAATSTSITVTVPRCEVVAPLTVVSNGKCSQSKVFKLKNTSTGSLNLTWSVNYFKSPQSLSKSGSIYAFEVGDMNNDGNLDIVAPTSTGLTVYTNPGSNSNINLSNFTTNNLTFTNSGSVSDIKLSDINNDGFIDIVCSLNSGKKVEIIKNNGDGTYTSQTSITFSSLYDNVNSLAIGDVNNDGWLDIAATSYGTYTSTKVQVFVQSSTTQFSFTNLFNSLQVGTNIAFCKRILIQDVNNDNYPELFFLQYNSGLQMVSNSNGTFSSTPTDMGADTDMYGYDDIYSIDLENDGDIDIICPGQSDYRIYTNDGSGSFTYTSTSGHSRFGKLFDIDNDNDLDIIGSDYFGISGSKNNAGTYASSTDFANISSSPFFYQGEEKLFDMNGDNYADVVFLKSDGTVFYYAEFQGNPQPPAFTSHPQTNNTQTICVNSSGTSLTVVALNADSYQWQQSTNSGTSWSNAVGSGNTTTSFTPAPTSSGTYIYRCVATNVAGSTNSNNSGIVTVNANPTLTTNPTTTLSQYCYSNPNTANGITVATSASSPSYQWQQSATAGGTFTNVTLGSGGTSATYYPSHVDIWYGGTKYYRCVVTSNGCSTTSNTKPYGVYADLTWTNPSNAAQNICINGSSTALSMTASGPNVVYSWQKSPNGTSSWTTISGANTNTYTPPTNVAGVNYYRCYISGTCSNTATAASGAITVTDTYTWTGTTSTDPSVAGNWNPAAVPCSGANKVIPSGLTNYPSYTNLTIDAGTTLTVNTGGSLTVTGTLTNNGTMTIESGATFIQGTSLAGSGTYNVKQALTNCSNDGSAPTGRYWYMGVPINSLTRGGAFGTASNLNRLWSWSESAQAWSSQITDATALTPTTGYVFRTGTDVTLNFSGTGLYSADASITGLTNTTGSFDGCHLMSNPYTAYLDWEAMIAAAGTTNLATTMCVRSYNTSSSQMVYDTYNATGDVAVQNSSYAVTRYIAPMQSFWITVNPSTTGTLSMTKAMLTHQPTAPGLKDLTSFPAFARLNLVDGSFTDQVVVYTDAEANAELEAFDSKKFFLPNVAQVYCKVGNDKLVINALKKGKAQTSAPLTVELPTTKVYKFEMAESFVDNGLVILEDRQEGIFQDMGINPTYEFFGNSGVIADRFVLHFQLPNGASNEGQAGVEDLTSSQIAVISNQNGSILVSLSADLTATGEVQVLDAAGRLIQTTAIKGQDTKLQITEGTGVYFVRVSTPMKSETKKVLVY